MAQNTGGGGGGGVDTHCAKKRDFVLKAKNLVNFSNILNAVLAEFLIWFWYPKADKTTVIDIFKFPSKTLLFT